MAESARVARPFELSLDPNWIERISRPLALGLIMLALLLVWSVRYDPAERRPQGLRAASASSAELPREWRRPQRPESFEGMYRQSR